MKRQFKHKGAWLLAALLGLASGGAGAVSLQQAYQAALKHDPTYRMHYYEREFGKEHRIIGRAGLLPSVGANFSVSKNVADQVSPHFLTGTLQQTHPRYTSRSSVVQLRQTLLNFDAFARYRQGKVASAQADAQFEANTNEVALRVLMAYCDVLFADDQAALAKVQRDMYLEQQKVNQRMYEKGEGTKTDMLETKARLDLAEAVLLEAEDNAAAKRQELAGVIGMEPGTLDRLSEHFRVGDILLGPFDEWQKRALQDNRELAAARLAVENARLEISRNQAGHMPRVDLVASYNKGESESLNTHATTSTNRTLGVQVNIPLYSGGAVNATTRQAAAGYERAKADLEVRTNKIMVELRKAHSLVESSVQKVNALVQAVESSKELMKATEQSIKGGVRINLDLLNAQEQLFTSQRDLAQARYAYLLGMLRLRAAVGIIGDSDIREIAAYFR